MGIKRKILSFTDFKKGKNTLENPVEHPIKESVSSVSRDEMIEKLNKKFPNIWTKKSEDFYKDPEKNTGIWTGGEGSTFVDANKEKEAFNVTGNGDKNYIDEVHKDLAKFLADNGWYTESYDAGTFFFYPINSAAESVTEAKKEEKKEKKEPKPEEASIYKRNILDFKKFKKGKDSVQGEPMKPVKPTKK